MAETSFDIIIVGGGPGGYVAAIRAAQLGMKAAVVERENMGGICLNWGCIPTKALLRTSEVYDLIKHADSFGLSVKDVAYDAKKVVERSRKVANQLSNGVKMLMRKNKITVFDGDAKLAGSEGGQRKLAVAMKDKSNVTLTAKNVILATGARARQLPGLESDGKLVWTYREAMVPPEFPKSLLVIGSGAIGIEFASFYRTMGTKVKVEKTHIVIDPWGFSGEPNVYALGDVAGPPWLAHKAMHEGVVVVEKIAGVKGVHPMDTSKVPGCTFCWPQVASVGLTESKAKEGGRKIKAGKFPFIGNGKAIALGEVEGFVKTVFDAETGELLGAHMIGAEVTELIQGYTIARTLEATDSELQVSIFPHPTLSEMMHEAVLAADGRPLH